MAKSTQFKRAECETQVQSALNAYLHKEYSSLRKAANAFKVPYPTVRARMAGRVSRSAAHETQQTLSNAEEMSLTRWVTRLTRTGFPPSPKLVIEMAEELRAGRVQLSARLSSNLPPIGYSWLERFKDRHPELVSIWTRLIEHARLNAADFESVRRWFDAVTELFAQHQYPPERIHNMDESGFAVGDSQSSRALVNVRESTSWKSISGRQEWITAIECINAAGQALPPLIIFKAKHTNSAWIPAHTPPEWRFSTSNSGWTSNSHGFEWLSTVYEPCTRPADPTARRLLIMDGHSSHITAKLIAFCMKHLIDLLILPPHCSHFLQPLDVSVFAPLKRALASETDAMSRLDSGRIARVEWTEVYIRARAKAVTPDTILSGWRSTGLVPLAPMRVLRTLQPQPKVGGESPSTPTEQSYLDLSLLDSSPPDGTELRAANATLSATLKKATSLPSPARRYTQRMAQAYETTHAELLAARRLIAEQQQLLNRRKQRTKGKRVALKGKFVFSTEEILKIARDAEAATAARSSKKRPYKRKIDQVDHDVEEQASESDSSSSLSDCIVVACPN